MPEHASIAAMMVAEAARQALEQAGDVEPAPVVLASVMGTRPVMDRSYFGLPGGSRSMSIRTGYPVWNNPRAIFDVMIQMGQTFSEMTTLLSVGCAGANVALDYAAKAVTNGYTRTVLAAAVDEYSVEVSNIFSTLRISANEHVKPFDRARDGTLPGEAATVFVLEGLEDAMIRDAPILGVLEATSVTGDAYHVAAPHPDGNGLRLAIRKCLWRSGLTGKQISWVCAHGTGTIANDALEAKTIHETLSWQPLMSSVKGAFGHAQGAAAGLNAAAAIWSLNNQCIPATTNTTDIDPTCACTRIALKCHKSSVEHVLSSAFGFGGVNSVAVFGRLRDE